MVLCFAFQNWSSSENLSPLGPVYINLLNKMSVNVLLGKVVQESQKFKNDLVHRNQHPKQPFSEKSLNSTKLRAFGHGEKIENYGG